MNENSRPRIPNEWVRYMYEKLESGELTYATVLKKVPYSYQNVTIFKKISRNTLKKAFKEIGGTPKIKSGPPQEELTPELILKVQNSYENYKCGVQKLYWTLNMNPKLFRTEMANKKVTENLKLRGNFN